MRNKFKFILFGLTLLTLLCYTATAAPSITPTPAAATLDTLTDNLPQAFSVTVSESSDIVWYLDESPVQSSALNQTSDLYSANPGSAGIYNVTVIATNSTTLASNQYTWTWNLNQSLSIDSSSPGSNPGTNVGDSQAFSVDLNQVADVNWYIDNVLMQTNSSVTSASYTNNTAPADSYTVKATASNVNGSKTETWTWTVSTVPSPTITLSDPSSSTPSDNTGVSRTFTANVDQTVNLTWIFNDVALGPVNNSVTTSSYTFSSAPEGTHNLTVLVENANGVDQKQWDWTVSNASLSITGSNPGSDPETTVDTTQLFNVTTNQACDVQWLVNGTVVQTNSSVTTADLSIFKSTAASYNVTVVATNVNGVEQKTWIWDVRSKTYFSGDRIWDADAGQSTTYTWDAKSFSGFFYDLESGLSSETMTITGISRTIGDEKLVYETRPVETDFEHSGWGKYQVIGFMAEKYFAGYTSNTSITDVDTVSMMSNGQLSKVLMDTDDKETVYSGSSLDLEDGYKLNVVEVDTNGDRVLLTLTKDGDELDSDVVSSNDDYVYKKDLGDSDNVVLIAVHFADIFSGTESNAVFVQGIFQVSDAYDSVENGDNYGKMQVTAISDNLIQMKNDGSVSLSAGKTIDIMGKIKFEVADDSTLRFAPFVDMTDPGTYELRGTVAEGNELITWTPLNFEGFYYDIDEGIQTETLQLTSISGRTIPSDALVYTSTPAAVTFSHSAWGKFNVMGFMAEKYFAGYPSGTFGSSSAVDLLSSGQLSKVLIDSDDKTSVYSGQSLTLENGYTLDIVEVDSDGNKVLVQLNKDGDEVDSGIASANDNYIYEMDLGDSDNVPVIVVHFNEIFRGSESNAVFIQGIFQISDDYTTIEDGDTNDKMEVTSVGSSIVMKNSNSISLSRGKEISLMGDVVIRVADSGTVRYYPAVDVTTSANEALSLSLSDSTITEGESISITVTSRGASISDATVKVDGSSIGNTGDDGTLDYTPSSTGTLDITTEKDGYTSGSTQLEVISKDDETRKMSIEVSPSEVYEGNTMTIYVLKAIGGDAISGAEITLDGKSIGTTGSDGTISYTATEPGAHKLVATKSGMSDAELDLKVNELAAKFEFSNLAITPLEIKQGQDATISVDVANTGTAAGDYTVDLKINDVVVDSQLVSLSVGNSTTIQFKHKEDEIGTYTVKVGGLTTTYEVFEKSGTILYVLGAIGLAAIGGIAYLFTAGGWTVEIAQAKAAEAIETIRELIGK